MPRYSALYMHTHLYRVFVCANNPYRTRAMIGFLHAFCFVYLLYIHVYQFKLLNYEHIRLNTFTGSYVCNQSELLFIFLQRTVSLRICPTRTREKCCRMIFVVLMYSITNVSRIQKRTVFELCSYMGVYCLYNHTYTIYAVVCFFHVRSPNLRIQLESLLVLAYVKLQGVSIMLNIFRKV